MRKAVTEVYEYENKAICWLCIIYDCETDVYKRQDDAWTPDKLEKQIELQKRTNADLLFTGSAFMDSDGQPIDWCPHAPAEVTYRQLLKQNVCLLYTSCLP